MSASLALPPPPPAAAGPAVEAVAPVLDDELETARFTRWVVGEGGQRLGESALQLSGLYCAACSGVIEQALLQVPGVLQARVSAATHRASVRWDPAATRPSSLIAAVQAAGYGAVPDAAEPARALRRSEHRAALWRLFVAAFCAMQVMMFATPSYVAAEGDLSLDMRQLLNWGSWVLTLPVLFFSGGVFFKGAWRSLRARHMGMDVPVALGLAVTFVASTGATFQPTGVFGREVYFDSLTMFLSFLLGARYLELLARHRAAESLEATMAALPEAAERLLPDGSCETVSVQRLRVGDVLRVPLGQAFPADGVLVQGRTEADEALLTGEALAVPKPEGAAVVAGSRNLGAPVLMQVQRLGADTRFEHIVAMMRDAQSQRPALARVADRWAGPFLWAVLVLAAAGATAWWFIDPSKAIWVAVSVLIVTCPCALSLAAPATLVAAARGLARRGVVLQRLDALEPLARVQHLFVDKTGTLTEAQPVLAGARLWPQAGVDEALARGVAAQLAGWSTHPLSRAIVLAWAGQGGAPGEPVMRGLQDTAGAGLAAHDDQGRHWSLGSAHFVGVAPQPEVQVWLACDGRPVLALGFEERVRAGAAQALAALQTEGVRTTLLSGDAPERALRLARGLPLHAVVAGATPQDKLAAVTAAQADGQCVAMVGDGVNDAPVLARADVSLAMGQGALVSRAQADAVVTSNQWADILHARHTAQRALAIVRQNFWWAATYNAACIPLALVGWLPPWAAGLGMAGSSLLVVGNALRAAR
ncbi:MAG: heavy metal translocating P-type ATPase [Rubrivivax sp.]